MGKVEKIRSEYNASAFLSLSAGYVLAFNRSMQSFLIHDVFIQVKIGKELNFKTPPFHGQRDRIRSILSNE